MLKIEYPNEYILDLSDEGHWLARWHNKTYPIGRDKDEAIKIVELLNKSHRPNLYFNGESLMVCWNHHDKHEKCDYEVLVEKAVERKEFVISNKF